MIVYFFKDFFLYNSFYWEIFFVDFSFRGVWWCRHHLWETTGKNAPVMMRSRININQTAIFVKKETLRQTCKCSFCNRLSHRQMCIAAKTWDCCKFIFHGCKRYHEKENGKHIALQVTGIMKNIKYIPKLGGLGLIAKVKPRK